jgi:dienelactone hydrolase
VLNEVGIGTCAVDSYTDLGLFIPADSGKIAPLTLTRIVDAFRALEVVAKDPRIDPSRIAVMDFSQGGAAALILAWPGSRKCTATRACSASDTYPPTLHCALSR